ncbi:MAG TPA: DUF4386 family protein [Anaerolineae bacterium]|nr:DUF4386 family protein [Anaerolineae bacterium]
MSSLSPTQPVDAQALDPRWKSLYKIGGVAALIATVLFVGDIVVLITGNAMLSSANSWLGLMQTDRVAGLLQLFFTDLVGVALLYPIFFALYAALRRTNEVYVVFATGFAFVGIAIVLATNINYSLLYFNDQYASAATAAQRSQIVTAGESFVALLNGTGPLMGGLFIEGAFVIVSLIMLRSGVFSKRIAYLGLVAHGLDVVHSLGVLVLAPFFGMALASTIGALLLAIGGTLQLIWYPLVGRRLIQLGRGPTQEQPVTTTVPRFAS